MNTQRLLNYARYDLTINKTFYRNSAVTSLLIFTSISLVSFLFRWAIYDKGEFIDSTGYYLTWVLMALCATAIISIFAGCVNHPLRNKQGRISTLTLPVSNSERYCWHLFVTHVGGVLVILMSIGIADLINALFSFLVKQSPIYSYTTMFFFDFPGIEDIPNLSLIFWVGIAGLLANTATFTFGNAVKWRYNIIFTILALWILQTIVSTFAVLSAIAIPNDILGLWADWIYNNDMGLPAVYYWASIVLDLAWAALFYWMSWVRYQKAAVTNRFNK